MTFWPENFFFSFKSTVSFYCRYDATLHPSGTRDGPQHKYNRFSSAINFFPGLRRHHWHITSITLFYHELTCVKFSGVSIVYSHTSQPSAQPLTYRSGWSLIFVCRFFSACTFLFLLVWRRAYICQGPGTTSQGSLPIIPWDCLKGRPLVSFLVSTLG